MERHQKKQEREGKKRMFKLFYTLLIIEYVVENEDVATSVIFPSEYECYEAMGNGIMDDLYDVLADTYGKDIMMYCRRTPFQSGVKKLNIRPKLRPDG